MLNINLEETVWSKIVLHKLTVAQLSGNICLCWTPPPPSTKFNHNFYNGL